MITHKLVFDVQTPIITNYQGIMFDSLIMGLHLQREGRASLSGVNQVNMNNVIDIDTLDLFARHESGYILASRLLCDNPVWDNMFWCKKINGNDILRYSECEAKINISKGKYKSYKEILATLVTPCAYFYFASDTQEQAKRVIDLSKSIYALGKKSTSGGGQCKLKDVIVCGNDVWRKIMRPIPKRMMVGTEYKSDHLAFQAYKPPYWCTEKELCIISGEYL